MVPLQHDVLGMVKFASADKPDRWESQIPWLDDTIGVAITVDDTVMEQHTLERVGRYITDLAEFDRKARTAMRTHVDDDSAVRVYLEHHLDDPDLIRPVLGLHAASAVSIDAFVYALRLLRVSPRPDRRHLHRKLAEQTCPALAAVPFQTCSHAAFRSLPNGQSCSPERVLGN